MSVIEGHSPIASLLNCDIFYTSAYFCSIYFYCYMYV